MLQVRMEMECVMRDVLEGGGRVKLIRINPQFPQNPGLEAHTVSIKGQCITHCHTAPLFQNGVCCPENYNFACTL